MYFSLNSKLKKDIKAERNKLTINCNDKQKKLVNTVKILGVLVDNKLSFSEQCSNICSKVNSKTFLLNKSLYLFTKSFVPILFKIFIQSQFDYCSTLIIHFSDKSNHSRLNTCFAKSIHRLLKLKLYSSTPEEQYNVLFSKFNILPAK